MHKKLILLICISVLLLASCNQKKNKLMPDEAKQIAEEAYIYAYPMLEHYKMSFVLTSGRNGNGVYRHKSCFRKVFSKNNKRIGIK